MLRQYTVILVAGLCVEECFLFGEVFVYGAVVDWEYPCFPLLLHPGVPVELFGRVFGLFGGFEIAYNDSLVVVVWLVWPFPILGSYSVPVVVGEALPAVLDDVLQYCVGHVSYLVFVEPLVDNNVAYSSLVFGGGFERDAHHAGLSSCMNWLKVLFPACWACVICWSVQSGCCCFR